MVFCKADFFSFPLSLLFSLHIYIFQEKSTCPGGLQAEILTKEKPALSFRYLISPAPPPQIKAPQKSQPRSPPLINSSDRIQAWRRH